MGTSDSNSSSPYKKQSVKKHKYPPPSMMASTTLGGILSRQYKSTSKLNSKAHFNNNKLMSEELPASMNYFTVQKKGQCMM